MKILFVLISVISLILASPVSIEEYDESDERMDDLPQRDIADNLMEKRLETRASCWEAATKYYNSCVIKDCFWLTCIINKAACMTKRGVFFAKCLILGPPSEYPTEATTQTQTEESMEGTTQKQTPLIPMEETTQTQTEESMEGTTQKQTPLIPMEETTQTQTEESMEGTTQKQTPLIPMEETTQTQTEELMEETTQTQTNRGINRGESMHKIYFENNDRGVVGNNPNNGEIKYQGINRGTDRGINA